MSTATTQRLSSLLVATMFIVVLALMATFGVRSAEAAGPIGGCPPSFKQEAGHKFGGLTNLNDPSYSGPPLEALGPSADGNNDGYTCFNFVADDPGYPKVNDQGQELNRLVWVDNHFPL
jgi:hypothetical protein